MKKLNKLYVLFYAVVLNIMFGHFAMQGMELSRSQLPGSGQGKDDLSKSEIITVDSHPRFPFFTRMPSEEILDNLKGEKIKEKQTGWFFLRQKTQETPEQYFTRLPENLINSIPYIVHRAQEDGEYRGYAIEALKMMLKMPQCSNQCKQIVTITKQQLEKKQPINVSTCAMLNNYDPQKYPFDDCEQWMDDNFIFVPLQAEKSILEQLQEQRKLFQEFKQLKKAPTIDWLKKQKDILQKYIESLSADNPKLDRYQKELKKVQDAIKKHELKSGISAQTEAFRGNQPSLLLLQKYKESLERLQYTEPTDARKEAIATLEETIRYKKEVEHIRQASETYRENIIKAQQKQFDPQQKTKLDLGKINNQLSEKEIRLAKVKEDINKLPANQQLPEDLKNQQQNIETEIKSLTEEKAGLELLMQLRQDEGGKIAPIDNLLKQKQTIIGSLRSAFSTYPGKAHAEIWYAAIYGAIEFVKNNIEEYKNCGEGLDLINPLRKMVLINADLMTALKTSINEENVEKQKKNIGNIISQINDLKTKLSPTNSSQQLTLEQLIENTKSKAYSFIRNVFSEKKEEITPGQFCLLVKDMSIEVLLSFALYIETTAESSIERYMVEIIKNRYKPEMPISELRDDLKYLQELSRNRPDRSKALVPIIQKLKNRLDFLGTVNDTIEAFTETIEESSPVGLKLSIDILEKYLPMAENYDTEKVIADPESPLYKKIIDILARDTIALNKKQELDSNKITTVDYFNQLVSKIEELNRLPRSKLNKEVDQKIEGMINSYKQKITGDTNALVEKLYGMKENEISEIISDFTQNLAESCKKEVLDAIKNLQQAKDMDKQIEKEQHLLDVETDHSLLSLKGQKTLLENRLNLKLLFDPNLQKYQENLQRVQAKLDTGIKMLEAELAKQSEEFQNNTSLEQLEEYKKNLLALQTVVPSNDGKEKLDAIEKRIELLQSIKEHEQELKNFSKLDQNKIIPVSHFKNLAQHIIDLNVLAQQDPKNEEINRVIEAYKERIQHDTNMLISQIKEQAEGGNEILPVDKYFEGELLEFYKKQATAAIEGVIESRRQAKQLRETTEPIDIESTIIDQGKEVPGQAVEETQKTAPQQPKQPILSVEETKTDEQTTGVSERRLQSLEEPTVTSDQAPKPAPTVWQNITSGATTLWKKMSNGIASMVSTITSRFKSWFGW